MFYVFLYLSYRMVMIEDLLHSSELLISIAFPMVVNVSVTIYKQADARY